MEEDSVIEIDQPVSTVEDELVSKTEICSLKVKEEMIKDWEGDPYTALASLNVFPKKVPPPPPPVVEESDESDDEFKLQMVTEESEASDLMKAFVDVAQRHKQELRACFIHKGKYYVRSERFLCAKISGAERKMTKAARNEMSEIMCKSFPALNHMVIDRLLPEARSNLLEKDVKKDEEINQLLTYKMASFYEITIIPEILTIMYMEREKLSYKEAILRMYEGRCPTVLHEIVMGYVSFLWTIY